jgi:hypothetical protein
MAVILKEYLFRLRKILWKNGTGLPLRVNHPNILLFKQK